MQEHMKICCDQNQDMYSNHLVELQSKFIHHIQESYSEAEQYNQKNVGYICHEVWVKFAKNHQKSPSRRNNNVQSCSSYTTRARAACSFDGEDVHSGTNSEPNYSDSSVYSAGLNNSEKSKSCSSFFILRYLFFLVFLSIKIWLYAGVVFVLFYCAIVLHKPTQAIVSINTQDLIYPLMRSLRVISVPHVKRFPFLSNLYEESCLISNPYFTMTDVDCWPCETSRSIVDLTGFSNFSAAYYGSGIPFIVKDAFQSDISIDDILEASSDYRDLSRELDLNRNLRKILSTRHRPSLPVPVPHAGDFDENIHIQWKINRVSSARLLRKYFPKPYFIPNNTEVSVQHYLFVDQMRSPTYPLPITEFANVFVTQANGARFIVLVPTDWCKKDCKVVSIVLQPQDVLFYNWLYWRPVSGPVESARHNLSVTYMGSFY